VRLSDFRFPVPEELIAQTPTRPRDASRLMCVRRASGEITHHVFRDLPALLDSRYVLVVNNSRVLKARVRARRTHGDEVAIYLLKDLGDGVWSCVADQVAVPAVGEAVTFPGSAMHGTTVAHHDDGTFELRLSGCHGVAAELERVGTVPLPPYVRDRSGEDQYQTVYARIDGSVAAPTAGLHFTAAVLDNLERQGIRREEITLHVGYGTFAAVRVEDVAHHVMPAETYTLAPAPAARLNADRATGRKILAVGTTATRTLESCADEHGSLLAGSGETRLFIHPPYRFRCVDALLTNFHMPGLTPVMLVAAFAGYDLIMRAYQIAVQERYRFYSFGDSMLVL
jgi:S-adenosylmethionine:tRNA ribosyltransferase-isomerase